QAHTFVAAGGMTDLVAFIPQVHAQQVGDMHIVFDDQDVFCAAHRCLRPAEGTVGIVLGRARRCVTKNLTLREDSLTRAGAAWPHRPWLETAHEPHPSQVAWYRRHGGRSRSAGPD